LAEKFYRLAAEQGNSEGQYNLAYYYESNYGKNDPKKAIELFQLAAEQGHYEATQVLEDKVRINAKKGDAEAQYQLAVMCLHNRHSPYGGKLSRITELSAKQGYVKAQYLLGLLYECGKYVPEGHPTGEIFGPVPRTIPNNFEPLPDSLFFMEDGVPSDFQKAIKWYLLAAKQGHKTAKQRLKKLDDSIDVEDLTVDKEKEHDKDADIQEIIKNKKVKHVVHFTRLVNLKGILSHGLITRKKIIELNILSDFNDSYRFDNQENSISCSIEFPNYKMLYKLQQDIPDTEWVVIILKPSVLWEKDCAFSNTNAASKSVTSIPIEQRKGADALKTMFDDLPEAPCREKLGIPANYPTDPQAEILVLENINPQYILNIATQSEETATRLQGIYPEFKFLYKQSIFNPRMDYNHWRSN
jgi:TPR repeat protein